MPETTASTYPASKNSEQPGWVWRRRRAIAFVTLFIVICATTPFVLSSIQGSLALWLFVTVVWAIGILLTWIAGRIQGTRPPTRKPNDPGGP